MLASIFELVMQILGFSGAGEEATGIVSQIFDAILGFLG